MDDKHITTDVEQPSVRPDNVGDGEHTYVWKDVVTEPPHHNNKPPKAPRGRRGLQVFAAVATTLCILSMMCASYFAIALLNDDDKPKRAVTAVCQHPVVILLRQSHSPIPRQDRG